MQTKKWTTYLAAVAAVTICVGFIAAPNFFGQAQAQSKTSVDKAIAIIVPTDGNKVAGVVTFTQTSAGVEIEAHLTGLTANQEHGFHIHNYGDLSKGDGTSAGGHYNPGAADHAGPNNDKRHVGDLGNIKADASGHGMYKRLDKHASLDMTSANCIIGRGVVVHGGTDDLKSQPSGAAGPRVAYGVIGIANPE